MKGTICIPDRRISKAKQSISDLLFSIRNHIRVPVTKVDSVVGQLISMTIVVGHVSQIMTRYLNADIQQDKYWDSHKQLCDESQVIILEQ